MCIQLYKAESLLNNRGSDSPFSTSSNFISQALNNHSITNRSRIVFKKKRKLLPVFQIIFRIRVSIRQNTKNSVFFSLNRVNLNILQLLEYLKQYNNRKFVCTLTPLDVNTLGTSMSVRGKFIQIWYLNYLVLEFFNTQ